MSVVALGYIVVEASDTDRVPPKCAIAGRPPGGPIDVEFYYCNRRHHTVALAPMNYPKRLHHFLLQVCEIDDLGRAIHRATEAGDRMSVTLGRHSNDRNVTVYIKSPLRIRSRIRMGRPVRREGRSPQSPPGGRQLVGPSVAWLTLIRSVCDA